jgi:hypothetical protein
MNVRLNGAWRTIDSGKVYLNGAWRTLNYANAYISGSWRKVATFIAQLTLAISPTSVHATNSSTTGTATATPSGGLGPFTYAWTLVSNSGVTGPQIASPTTASTQFYGTPTDGSSGSCVFRCTVTDSLGSTATADITATFATIPLGGP